MVASSAGAPSLTDVEILSAPNGVTLPQNFLMARGKWLQTQLIVGTCFGVYHNTSDGLKEFGEEMSAIETELEEYIPRDTSLRSQIPVLILRHAQIRWSNWIADQWGKTSEVSFPNLAGLWTTMENQEPWYPTLPAGYTLSPDTTYGGSVSTHPTHGPAYPARCPTLDTSAAPTSAATASTVAPTAKAESARRSSGSCGIGSGAIGGGGSLGRGSGGVGGGGEGAKERLNAMAYNNAYIDGRWGLFRHAGAMRIITRKTSLAGVELPALPIEPTYKACPAFHIKGM